MKTIYAAMYTLDGLAAETGMKPRTIRSWIERGLMPKAHPRTNNPQYDIRYGVEHVRAIRRVQQIKDGNMTLDDIRDRIEVEEIA